MLQVQAVLLAKLLADVAALGFDSSSCHYPYELSRG
jgi:hypothetical protein